MSLAFSLLLAMSTFQTPPGVSVYALQPDDPHAVVVTGTTGDCVADDSGALQGSVDAVEGQGAVLVPEGLIVSRGRWSSHPECG